ncbi:hypothetical protein NY593_00305, partial [Enterobacter asburiae]|uniref:hypothetical protein n=1 Tax=Enterobacter asburiae TaxID=61645 RepID=UPI0022F08A32
PEPSFVVVDHIEEICRVVKFGWIYSSGFSQVVAQFPKSVVKSSGPYFVVKSSYTTGESNI